MLGEVLAKIKKIPLQDAIQKMKPRWGLIEENITSEEASVLDQGLTKVGLEHVVVPQQTLAVLQAVSYTHLTLPTILRV